MSELGRFLEVVYGPREAFRTVQGTLRQWRNKDLAESASGGGRTAMGRKKTGADGKPTIETAELSFSLSMPNRLRIEKTDTCEEQVHASLVVVNGDQWWFRDHQGHVELSESKKEQRHKPPIPGLNNIERHFYAASLRDYFVGLSLEQIGTVETAGRACIRLRAVPRAGARLWPHWLPYGAEEYEFHADPERGALLFGAAQFGGEVFEIYEVTLVKFDEPLDDALFSYSPMEGEQLHAAEPIAERLTLETAISRMPFVVLVPSRLSAIGGEAFEVMYHPPRLRSPRAHLGLMYRGGHSFWINQAGTADPIMAKMEWEQFERHGRQMALSDPGVDAGMRIVALEQDGTHVTIFSDMDREQLLEIASSLMPAKSSG